MQALLALPSALGLPLLAQSCLPAVVSESEGRCVGLEGMAWREAVRSARRGPPLVQYPG